MEGKSFTFLQERHSRGISLQSVLPNKKEAIMLQMRTLALSSTELPATYLQRLKAMNPGT